MDFYYKDNDTVIYNVDNIELLKKLDSESINLIYCDILYNTGKVFDDYSDNLGAPKEALEWYRVRIKEMKRVLAKNGSIFIHCNWRLDSYMRILMDEIFGSRCFRNRIYRKHSDERGFHSNFDSQVDIILYYTKNETDFVFNELTDNKLKLFPLFENGYFENHSKIFEYNDFKIDLANQNKHWIINENQLKLLADRNEIILIKNLPYRYSYNKSIGNLWCEPEMLDTYNRAEINETYDTPKPEAILERIITMCSNKGDVVADFFMGGGTTVVVAKKLGRQGIFCDISKKACDVAINKIKNLL
jgi:DNA modification methylase